MIRFIDLKGDDDPAFAFSDTITDRLVVVGNEYMWRSREDFLGSCEGAMRHVIKNRCLELIPEDWPT